MIKKFLPFRQMSTINRLCCCLKNENNLSFEERDEYVGIQEYVGQHPKMNALVKHRFSHFHVNEIGLDGKIVHLTDLTAPPRPAEMTPGDPFYVHCTLYKEAISHNMVLDDLIKGLRIQMDDIGTAGIKDKWGKTSQKISIRNVDPHVLAAKFDKNRHVKLGNFTYEKHPIRTGDLIGNHFRILLLNVTSHNGSSSVTEDIQRAVASLKDFGFVNYYGCQRFSFGHKGPLIGKAMLQMNWEEVFDLILSPKEDDPDDIKSAKSLWFSKRDPMEIIRNLPSDVWKYKRNYAELCLLQGLAKHYDGGKGQLIEAYRAIPEYLRLLNYAAIKSFLWNHLLSYRIRTFGLKPVPGDVVNIKTLTRGSKYGIESPGSNNEGKVSDLLSHEIRVLTENNFDSNGNCLEFSIFDVILDSPGSKMTMYSNPKVQTYFEKLMEINQLEVGCFAKLREKFGEIDHHIRAFRHIVHRPIDLTYEVVPYAQKKLRDLDRIIPSDLDLLHIKRSKSSMTETKREHGDNEKICVIVEFSLPKSTYATVALRELLKSTNVWK